GSKYMRGEDIGKGDWTKLGLKAASMAPYAGIPAIIADQTMEHTGLYKKMNTSL
ncbi:unnamed protein product, partial [marine sediment metagenome]